jgi:hypothetical protein
MSSSERLWDYICMVSDVNRLQMSVEGHAYQFHLRESESVLLRMDRDFFLQDAFFGIAQDSRSTSALKEPIDSLATRLLPDQNSKL